jgi:hypothetical protein
MVGNPLLGELVRPAESQINDSRLAMLKKQQTAIDWWYASKSAFIATGMGILLAWIGFPSNELIFLSWKIGYQTVI